MVIVPPSLLVTREIPLTQGRITLVDDDDFERVSQFRWRAYRNRDTFYAIRSIKKPDGRWTTQHLHTFITGYIQTDHWNGDGLDNRRSNLRIATDNDNRRNSKLFQNNTSGYKGVSWDKGRRLWRVQVSVNGTTRYVGRYDDIIEAARAYDEAARKWYGEFARTNFP